MKYSKIYVVCPYGLVTGGPDALHQLVFYLNKNSIFSNIVYSDINDRNKPIPEPYKLYLSDYCILSDVKDEKGSAIIVPETLTHLLKQYKNLDKYIWWLSVQNDTNASFFKKIVKVFKKMFDLNSYKKLYKLNTLKNFVLHKPYNFDDNDEIIHLCASYYAYNHVENNNKKGHLLIEPISKKFLENINDSTERKNYILYNPKKNYKFTKKIIKKNKELQFIPLTGFSQNELIELYSHSKLYIDFGNFPGAERIPKEAVLNGTAIITGKNGASAFYDDVPIPDEYKFDSITKNVDEISKKINYVLENFFDIKKDFNKYRETVLSLEDKFEKKLIEYFG